MNEPKIISEKVILKTEVFDVKRVKLVFPKGLKRTHYIAERLPIVSVIPLSDNYEVFLVSQYRYLLRKVFLEATAGHVEKNETPLTAAKRELKEETGIVANHWEELARIEMGASAFRSKVNLFLAKNFVIGKPAPTETENINIIKMPLTEAVEKVLRGEINHSVTLIGILLLDKLRKEGRL